MVTSPIAAGGLVLDIAGALALASAFMLKRPGAWHREATTFAGINAPLLLSGAKQTADAWVGGLLFAAGFGAQFSASAGANPSWASLRLTLPVALALGALAGVMLWRFLRPLNVRRAVAYDLERRWAEYLVTYRDDEGKAMQEWRFLLESWGYLLYKERRAGEGLPEFGRRLLGKRLWRRVAALPPAA